MAQKTIWHCVRDNIGFQRTERLLITSEDQGRCHRKESSLKGQLELQVAEKKSKEGVPEDGVTCVHGAVGGPGVKGEDRWNYVGAPWQAEHLAL